ncbi:MAG: 6-bladed beta-propeller [Bacteroidales bacterium]|nr:6-bladed beta-propeller [Bacteroidales bacterium]
MKKVLIGLISLVCCVGYAQDLKKSKKVADKVKVGKQEVVVGNRTLLKDTVTLPLSFFTEELKMIKLENKDEALASTGSVIIGEQHILVKGSGDNPYKLFTKDGKYITNIGARGRGAGEYGNVYDEFLDEKHNRIYILPWSTNSILVYDLKGKVLDPVRLPMNVPKGKIFVDPSGTTVSVLAVPFTGSPYIVWTQKISGELVSGIAPGHLAINPRDASGSFTGFNNEAASSKNTSNIDIFLSTFGARLDTLYHYDIKGNKLIPKFAMKYGSSKVPIFWYAEWPHHYVGNLAEPKQISESMTTTTKNVFFIIEKSSLKGSFFKLYNDFLGDMEIGWPSFAFSNGYYIKNYDPGDLIEDLEKLLSSNKKMSSDMRKKLTDLKNSVKETDNNYIFYAKLK